jgi:hypothetical protein
MRAGTVAIAICAWIAVSNHCAFSAISASTKTVESECPFHSKPAKQKETPSNLQCCKILRAVMAQTAKSWERDRTNFADIDLSIEQTAVCEDSHNRAPLLLDTGPPGKTSFVELIGSVRAHAPPFSA